MPMATAVWLVENTSLTFEQIANFCKLHEVEIQGIADGEVAKGIVGYNPIIAGQLTREEKNLSSKNFIFIKSLRLLIKFPAKKIPFPGKKDKVRSDKIMANLAMKS